MLLIGLTGSLATGKSTVSNILRSAPYDLPIIDADLLARQVVEPGTYGYSKVVKAFGPTTPDLLLPPPKPDGEGEASEKDSGQEADHLEKRDKSRPINRAVLGRRVFGSTPDRVRDRKVLNGIIHPLVRLAIAKAILYHYVRGYWAVVLDIPLLFESGLDIFCGVVVMVAVRDAEVQMQRLRERDSGLSAQEAEERVGSQMQVMEKVERTIFRGPRKGVVIYNDGTMNDLRDEIDVAIKRVESQGGGTWKRVWLWGSPLAVFIFALWEIILSYSARRRFGQNRRKRSS